MSSIWKDARNKPFNVYKSTEFNANWGEGAFTCIHSMNDAEGPWWKATFGARVTISKV